MSAVLLMRGERECDAVLNGRGEV